MLTAKLPIIGPGSPLNNSDSVSLGAYNPILLSPYITIGAQVPFLVT